MINELICGLKKFRKIENSRKFVKRCIKGEFMKTGRCTLIYLALFIDLIFSTWISALPETNSRSKNLFIIILNSIRYSDAFGDKRHLYIENTWEKIRPYGTLCENVYNNSITLPLPAQSVLLTGVSPGNAGNLPELLSPTLFEYYRKQSGALQNNVLFAVSDSSWAALACSNNADYGKAYEPNILVNDTGETDENAVYKKTTAYIKENHPSLVVLSLTAGKPFHHHKTDKECQALSRGLKDACGTAESMNMYYEGIILDDMIILGLWEKIQADQFYKDNTVFLVVSSQGRHTSDYSSYGDNCEGCTRLLFLIAGPGVRKNHVSGKKRYLTDVLPTVGKLMGIKTEHATGNIMNEVISDK
jgi:hypothetical protein